MKTPNVVILLFCTAAIALGCSPPWNAERDRDKSGQNDAGGGAQRDSLFVPAIDGSYDFATASDDYIGPKGYTLWSLSCPGQTPFLSRDVLLRKESGNLYAGYGIVFCEHGLADGNETMLVAMINAAGLYTVGEATGSVYSPYTSSTWINANATSTVLNLGYGATNELVVSREQNTGRYTVSLNGNLVFSFEDKRLPFVEGGGEGYIAVISPLESFPDKPVKISYAEP